MPLSTGATFSLTNASPCVSRLGRNIQAKKITRQSSGTAMRSLRFMHCPRRLCRWRAQHAQFRYGARPASWLPRFFERYGLNMHASQADHAIKLAACDEIYGMHSPARGGHAIERRGLTATLDMAQNGHANFLVEHFVKRESDGVGDGSRATRWNRLAAWIGGGKLRAFRHNDKAVMATANFALSNGFADGLKRKGNFRDEDDVCSARGAGVQRNPACVASHDFNEHDAMVALRSSVEAVDGLGGDEDGGVETKRDVGGGKVNVNGLGHCNDVHAFAHEIAGDVLRTVTADNHKCINAQAAGVFQTKIGIVAHHVLAVFLGALGKRIATIGGAKNRAAAWQNAADGFLRQFLRTFRPDEAVETVVNAEHAHPVRIDRRARHATNRRV